MLPPGLLVNLPPKVDSQSSPSSDAVTVSEFPSSPSCTSNGIVSKPGSLNSPGSGKPPPRHNKFFFEDGNVTFSVENTLYRPHRFFFTRDSPWFANLLSPSPSHSRTRTPVDNLPVGWHRITNFTGRHVYVNVDLQEFRTAPPPHPVVAAQAEPQDAIISLEGVTSWDFEAFLSVLYPTKFSKSDLTTQEEWMGVLDLAARWSFESIRDLAIERLDSLLVDPLKRLTLARMFGVEDWIKPALTDLCARQTPLDAEDIEKMEARDVALVSAVRELLRARNGLNTVALKTAAEGLEDWIRGPTNVEDVGHRTGGEESGAKTPLGYPEDAMEKRESETTPDFEEAESPKESKQDTVDQESAHGGSDPVDRRTNTPDETTEDMFREGDRDHAESQALAVESGGSQDVHKEKFLAAYAEAQQAKTRAKEAEEAASAESYLNVRLNKINRRARRREVEATAKLRLWDTEGTTVG
ncbi:hypothetical protein OF83DRAFT_1246866 [Amylostereum chailletii]|nr:hypothetical protein OF83DRAFT_1246866 [Amylostereum chailletii]